MTPYAAFLEDRGVIRVSGPEAGAFLQGLVTNDVAALPIGGARFAALLSPQGKILFDFLVLRVPAQDGAAFLLDCAAALAADLAKRLGFYRLRAKVGIADESADHGVIAFWGEAPENAPGGFIYADPRDARLGHRAILPRAKAIAVGEGDAAAYHAHRIALGVPEGGADFAYGDAFPADANMDLLNGLDFEKGCYVGQEVVSRMRHRSSVRKRIVRLRLEGEAPPPGTPVMAGGATLGVLGSSAGGEALAMLRLDRLEEAIAAGTPAAVGRVRAGK